MIPRRLMRLPRKCSMSERAEFAQVKKHGESRPGRYLVVSILRSDVIETQKVGFITTKKVGKAHERNLLRRRFRAIIQNAGEKLKPGFYIVTIARWRAKEATYQQLENDWLKQASKLGITIES